MLGLERRPHDEKLETLSGNLQRGRMLITSPVNIHENRSYRVHSFSVIFGNVEGCIAMMAGEPNLCDTVLQRGVMDGRHTSMR